MRDAGPEEASSRCSSEDRSVFSRRAPKKKEAPRRRVRPRGILLPWLLLLQVPGVCTLRPPSAAFPRTSTPASRAEELRSGFHERQLGTGTRGRVRRTRLIRFGEFAFPPRANGVAPDDPLEG